MASIWRLPLTISELFECFSKVTLEVTINTVSTAAATENNSLTDVILGIFSTKC